MPPVAIVAGAAVAGAAGSVIAANKNKSAINKSTDASLQANRESIAAQEKAFAQQLAFQKDALDKGLAYQTNALNMGAGLQTDLYNNQGKLQTDLLNRNTAIMQPWAAGGGAAFNQLNSMLGLPGQTFSAPQQMTFTPITAPVMTNPAAPVTPAPGATPAPAPGTPAPAPATGTPAAPGNIAGPANQHLNVENMLRAIRLGDRMGRAY